MIQAISNRFSVDFGKMTQNGLLFIVQTFLIYLSVMNLLICILRFIKFPFWKVVYKFRYIIIIICIFNNFLSSLENIETHNQIRIVLGYLCSSFIGFYLVDFAWSVGKGNNEIYNEVKKVGDKEIDKEIKKEVDNKEIDKEVKKELDNKVNNQGQKHNQSLSQFLLLLYAAIALGFYWKFLHEHQKHSYQFYILATIVIFITCCSQNSSLFKAITIIFISMIQKSLKHLSFGYQKFLFILLLQSIATNREEKERIRKKKDKQQKDQNDMPIQTYFFYAVMQLYFYMKITSVLPRQQFIVVIIFIISIISERFIR